MLHNIENKNNSVIQEPIEKHIDRASSAIALGLIAFFSACALSGFLNQFTEAGSLLRILGFPISAAISFLIIFISQPYLLIYRSIYSTLSLLLIIIIIAVSVLLMDKTWDGLAYHQRAVWHLVNGVNFLTEIDPTENIWVNNYAKATWYYAATIYDFFGKSEAGSSYNLLLMFFLYFYSFRFLSKIGLKLWYSIILSILISFNPVIITQLFSYYNDAALAALSTAAIMATVLITRYEDKNDFFIFILISVISVNIKSSAIIFIGSTYVYLSIFYIYKYRDIKSTAFKLIPGFVLFILFGYIVFGFSPYMNNLLSGRHIFYPLAGSGAYDIMTYNSPNGFMETNKFINLFMSLFSEVSNINLGSTTEKPLLKIPGLIYANELNYFYTPDMRISGFGPLFSLIIIIGLVSFIFTRIRWSIAGPLLFMIILNIAINPYPWWARYIPILWLLPLIPLIAKQDTRAQSALFLRSALFLVVIANISLVTYSWMSTTIQEDIESKSRIYSSKNEPILLYSDNMIADLQLTGMGIKYEYATKEYYEKNKEKFHKLWGGILYEVEK